MKRVGFTLAILSLLVTVNSTYFFLVVSKVRLIEWLVFNACAPSSIAYLAGFAIFLATRNRAWLHVAILPLLFFGGVGLFLFPWNGYNLIAQFSHMVMVANVLWVLYETSTETTYRTAFLGLLAGTVFFIPWISYQQTYAYTHPDALKRVLGVSSEDFQQRFNMTGNNKNEQPNE